MGTRKASGVEVSWISVLLFPPLVREITCDQMTEPDFQGEYTAALADRGTYLCRQCGLTLSFVQRINFTLAAADRASKNPL